MLDKVIGVKQLNFYVKTLLEGDARLVNISVEGEISNLKIHYSSGHWYFTLKDNEAAVRCVMFKGSASKVMFAPEDGMSVVITGRVSIYEKDGQYQFYAEEMHSSGEGDLAVRFRQLKEKLENEGLFAEDSKRPINRLPKRIAVITSESGAAVQDILKILARRFPLCEVVMCPVIVQGDMAVPSMIDALDRVYCLDGIDSIIIGRGGGSAEDLQAFNSEELARKIYESPIPVISAVGHETDFTICDFVADKRAATPSAAAELAVFDMNDIAFTLFSLRRNAQKAIDTRLEILNARLEAYTSAASLSRAQDIIDNRFQAVDKLCEKMFNLINSKVDSSESKFEQLVAKLDTLSPLKTLSRGFAIPQKKGKTLKSVKDIEIYDELNLQMADGFVECSVKAVTERNDINVG